MGHALWLRKEAARRGYAWRQQQRARPLSFVTSRVCASLWRCWRGLAVRAFWSRRFGGDASGSGNERDEHEYEWQGFRRGCWGLAVRSVLEDHETAVLELERVDSSIEDRISQLELQRARLWGAHQSCVGGHQGGGSTS